MARRENRTTAGFLASLKECGLLSAERLAAVGERSALDGVVVWALADWLVEQEWLTRWQADHLLEGETFFFLGEYMLLDHIATGGMGSVYKGKHAKTGEVVAVKLLSQESMSDPVIVARFQREIDLAGTLKHPTIVAAHHAGRSGDLYYFVMEFVSGVDLWEWGQRYGQLPIDFACECIRQACIGLEYASANGMVHRDLKPANLIVVWPEAGGPPICKILDMGLARFRSEHVQCNQLTSTGQFVGTPDYVAPEQARNAKTADVRSDVYSLGVTLFELLSGRLPYAASSSIEGILLRERNEAPRLRSKLPDAPAELDAVIAKMMLRDPAQRYQRPGEVARDLEPFCEMMRNPDI